MFKTLKKFCADPKEESRLELCYPYGMPLWGQDMIAASDGQRLAWMPAPSGWDGPSPSYGPATAKILDWNPWVFTWGGVVERPKALLATVRELAAEAKAAEKAELAKYDLGKSYTNTMCSDTLFVRLYQDQLILSMANAGGDPCGPAFAFERQFSVIPAGQLDAPVGDMTPRSAGFGDTDEALLGAFNTRVLIKFLQALPTEPVRFWAGEDHRSPWLFQHGPSGLTALVMQLFAETVDINKTAPTPRWIDPQDNPARSWLERFRGFLQKRKEDVAKAREKKKR